MSEATVVFIAWGWQIITHALFDTRKDSLNKLMNIVALVFSVYLTFRWGGIFWLVVPILILPLAGGLIGGVVKGLLLKNKDSKENNS